MVKFMPWRVLLLCLLCLAPAAVRGQSQDENFKVEDEEAAGPTRKAPSLFHRPTQKTPEAQLQYADSLRRSGRLRKAMKQYNNLVYAWPNAPEAPKAQRAYADLLLERENYEAAFDQYQYLVTFYAGNFPFDEVLEKQFQIANYVKTARHARFFGLLPGVTDPQQALPLYKKIVQNAPNWTRSQEALFYEALIYEEDKDYDKAIQTYEEIQQRYHGTTYAGSAAFARARCLFEMAHQRLRDEGQVRAAVSAFGTFIHDYPSDPNIGQARKFLDDMKVTLAQMYYDRAVYYDQVQKNAKAAIISYRDLIRTFPVPDVPLMSNLCAKASMRIEELEAGKENVREK
jgi:tetratricopeptide (TPR) repeat protein